MCKLCHETDAPEIQIKKHIHNVVLFGHVIIEKVQQFDQDHVKLDPVDSRN